MKRALFVSALALLVLSCTAQRRAQVLVTVDAQPGVDRLSDTVQIRMWGRGENDGFAEEVDASEPGTRYPWTVALRPRNDDSTRFFRFEATALNPAGEPVATARVISGYEPGQVLHVYLLLQDSCIGVPCTDLSSTCRNGMCVEIPEPTFFDPDAGFPDAGGPTCEGGPSVESCDRMDNDCDGATDETFDFLEDEGHCGGCDRPCDPSHATGVCEGGSCAIASCDDGWADCNLMAVDGCEANLLDPRTCGSCDTSCPAAAPFCEEDAGGSPACVATCTSGVECGGSCVDTMTDESHCGGCSMACATPPFVTTTCEGGTCRYACETGRDSCNGELPDADGCETNVATDTLNCGSCSTMCGITSECQEPVCAGGSCSQRAVMDGRSCDADGRDCTTDTCTSGICMAGPCIEPDAGRDAGRDAGPDADAGRDAGTCGGDTCTSGETCCGSVCCDTSSGDMCCGASQCCTMGLEMCSAGACVPIGDPDAGGSCGGCPTGSCCPDGVTCCMPPFECCGASCCDNSIGELCDGAGSCVFPDAGGPSDPCGGSCMTPADCCPDGFGHVCCDSSLGESCSPGFGCFGLVSDGGGPPGPGFDAAP